MALITLNRSIDEFTSPFPLAGEVDALTIARQSAASGGSLSSPQLARFAEAPHPSPPPQAGKGARLPSSLLRLNLTPSRARAWPVLWNQNRGSLEVSEV